MWANTKPMSDFFRKVDLPANGYTVTIRKVDVSAVQQKATLEALVDGAIVELGEDVLAAVDRLGMSQTLTPDLLKQVLAAGERINQQMIRESVVDWDGLLSAYKATGLERDFGLGPDFNVLIAAINEHNGIQTMQPAQAAGVIQNAVKPKRTGKK